MAQESEPDIILLTETWCNDSTTNASLALEKYNLECDLRRDRSDTTAGIGGGLLVYSKKELRVLPIGKYDDNEFNQFCAFKISTSGEQLNLILAYRPPSSPQTNTEALCKLLRNLDNNSILIGDINMPGIDWAAGRADGRGRELLETMTEEGLQQMVSFPTHTKGNILDLLITNCPERVVDVQDVGRLGKSDHCMICVAIECQPFKRQEKQVRLNWNRANIPAIRQDIVNSHWREELGARTVEEGWAYLNRTLEETIGRNVPINKGSIRFKHPWMTREILKLIRKKRRKWRTAKNSHAESDMKEYKRVEKEVSNKIRNAKRKLEKGLVSGPDKNNRKYTQYVKSKTKSRTPVGPLVTKEKKIVTENKEMAEILNQFFSSVFTKEDLSYIPDAEMENVESTMRPVQVTRREVEKKIRNLRKDAAAGPDGISPRLLKDFETELSVPLEILFNKSLREGEVPSDWRKANVAPIYKKGPKGDPGNYRPVSLTSVPCKILESLIKDKLMEHLIQNKLIKDTQHGFIPGKSCATNLTLFMDTVTKATDEGKAVDIIYLDFAKAFDKVPHQRLLTKLRAKGVDTQTVKWIESWLSNRTQNVNIQGEKSESCDVDSGVPQGTVLGPILFTVYIDDLEVEVTRRLLEVLILKFADDTKGAKVIENAGDRDKLQEALDCLCNWAEKWGMEFNVAKCKVMHVGRNNPEYDYTMRGVKLGKTEEEKDIGVTITKNLKPSVQCEKAAGRAASVLNQIWRNFHYRDRHTFVRLYKQYVRPHLEFASPSWSPWLTGDIERLEKVQEKAVKMVAGLKSKIYSERCKELGLETLEERRKKQDLALVHKLVREGQEAPMLVPIPEVENRVRTRRAAAAHGLAAQYARTDVRKFSFPVRVVESWNRLPDSVKTTTSKDAFKRMLRQQQAAH